MAEFGPTGATFSVGDVLVRSFGVLFRNLVPFGLISLVLLSPVVVVEMTIGREAAVAEAGILSVADQILGYLVAAILVYGTLRDLAGHAPTLSEVVAGGLQVAAPAIPLAIVYGLIVAVGLLLLVVPGLVFLSIWWVLIPAVAVERRGIGAGLVRAVRLTKGYRWQVFALVVIVLILKLVVLPFVVAALSYSTGFAGASVLAWMLGALLVAFDAVMLTVGYHDLRVANEGVDTAEIAAALD